MGGMPGEMSKGRFFTTLDGVLNAKDASGLHINRLSIVDDLGTSKTLSEVLKRYVGGGLSDDDYLHLDREWFVASERWWPTEPTDAIVRRGFENALRNVGELPIETVWGCTSSHVSVIAFKSAQQMTVLINTPPVPDAWLALNERKTWVSTNTLWVTKATGGTKLGPRGLPKGLALVKEDSTARTVEVQDEEAMSSAR